MPLRRHPGAPRYPRPAPAPMEPGVQGMRLKLGLKPTSAFFLICALTILKYDLRVCCCVHGFSRCKLPGAQPWGVP